MIGLPSVGKAVNRRNGALSRMAEASATERPSAWARPRPPRSAPAQNARSPAPVRTITRTPSSALARSNASSNSSVIRSLSALRASGRFSVIRAIRPSTE